MKTFLIGLAVLLLSLSAIPKPANTANEELFKTVRDSAWAIYLRNVGGMQAICSASAFASDKNMTLLLTAGHCFMGQDLNKTDFLVTRDHRNFYKASLKVSGLIRQPMSKPTSTEIEDYRGNDWAVAQADVGNQPVLPFGNSDNLVIGEDLIVVGLPFGMDFLAVQGIVGSTDLSLSALPWNHYFGANIFIAGGNSGSAVIGVKQRAIVGIVVAGPGAQSSLCIFTPINLVKADLKKPAPVSKPKD